MNSNDPRYRLIEIVDTELKSGESEADVIKKLMKSGLEEAAAISVVNVVQKSRSIHKIQIATFAFTAIAIALCINGGLYYLLGRESFIELSWPLFGLFIVFWCAFMTLGSFDGKRVANARRILSYITFLITTALSGALFLNPEWVAQETLRGASWRYYILKFFVDAVYFIGPMIFACIFLLLSFAALLLTWAEFHKYRNGDYGKM